NRSLNYLRDRKAAFSLVNGNGEPEEGERRAANGGESAAEQAARREELRHLVDDLRMLPETQRTAIVLRELEAMSYCQVAEAMDTTVGSVKSLLVRGRLALSAIRAGRELSCTGVRYAVARHEEGTATL